MPRYIDADELRYIESDKDAYTEDWNDDYEKGFSDAINKVLELPTVEAEPVRHGRWIRIFCDDYECSECKAAVWSRPPYPIERNKYCWSCGAKMNGGEENNG